MLDLRQLQALAALSREGSVAKAARSLGWSQPTINYHLKNLDALVGTELTTRTPRGTTLTTTGRYVLSQGEIILSLAERTLAEAKELAEEGRTRLRFGTFPTAAAHLLPDIARQADREGIDLENELSEIAPLVNRVNRHTLDAALVYAAGGYNLPFHQSVHTVKLFRDPLLIAMSAEHRFAQLERLSTADLLQLSDEPWVTGSTPGDTVDDLLHHFFGEAGKQPLSTVRSDDYQVVLGLIAAGMGVGMVPRMACGQVPEGVVLKPVEDKRFNREVLLVAPAMSGGPSLAVRKLASVVRSVVKEKHGWAVEPSGS